MADGVTTDQGRVYVGLADLITPEGAERLVTLRLEPNAGDVVVMTAEKALEVASRLMLRVSELGEL